MTVFGDYDPDDAYDAADGFRAVVINFVHRLDFLGEHVVAVDIDDDIDARLARFRADLVTLHNRVVAVISAAYADELGPLEPIVLPP